MATTSVYIIIFKKKKMLPCHVLGHQGFIIYGEDGDLWRAWHAFRHT